MPEATRKSPIALDGLTVPELTALIEAAEAKRSEKMEGAKAALVSEFRSKAAELGMSLESLMARPKADGPPRKARQGTGAKAAAKYRNPETGETWSGRGREPLWIKGKNREDFTVGAA